MRTVMSLFVVGLFVGGLAVTGHAQQNQPYQQDQQNQNQQDQPSQQNQPPQPPGPASPDVVHGSYSAQVTGEVTAVDHGSGKLTLRTASGQFIATLPPEAVQHVKEGDRVTVAIGLIEEN